MSGIKVEYFDTPEIKHWDEMQPGDVFRTEYGDYGNYVAVIFDYQELLEMNWIKTVGRFVDTGVMFEGYAINHNNSYKYKIIGKEVVENGID